VAFFKIDEYDNTLTDCELANNYLKIIVGAQLSKIAIIKNYLIKRKL